MARSAFKLSCLASFLACIGTLILWQRSYRGCDVLIGQRGPADHFTCTSKFGDIVFELEDP